MLVRRFMVSWVGFAFVAMLFYAMLCYMFILSTLSPYHHITYLYYATGNDDICIITWLVACLVGWKDGLMDGRIAKGPEMRNCLSIKKDTARMIRKFCLFVLFTMLRIHVSSFFAFFLSTCLSCLGSYPARWFCIQIWCSWLMFMSWRGEGGFLECWMKGGACFWVYVPYEPTSLH